MCRHLNDGQPLLGVFLVPDTIDIDGSGSVGDFPAFLLHPGEEVDVILIKTVVRAIDLHANCRGHLGDILELDDGRVLSQ